MSGPRAQQINLLDSLTAEWLKLPLAAMRDVGPAVQTLGGLLALSKKETFCPVARIARRARVPVATSRKHLDTLAERGWISNAGRERTRRGAPRRTCTLRITAQTTQALGDYGVLPWWACCTPRHDRRLSWSARAVLSLVMARLMALRAAVDRQDGSGLDAENIWGSIENMGGEDRWRYPLDVLERQTGLTQESLVAAKRHLDALGIVRITHSYRDDGGTPADLLVPSPTFCAVETPAGEGRCYVTFWR